MNATNPNQLQLIKSAIDDLLRPRNQVASLDMYLLDDWLIIPLARPKTTIEGQCWPLDTTMDIVDLWQLELEEAK